jgi:hypothetical protein
MMYLQKHIEKMHHQSFHLVQMILQFQKFQKFQMNQMFQKILLQKLMPPILLLQKQILF